MAKAAQKLGPPTSRTDNADYLGQLDQVPVSVVRFQDIVNLPGSLTSTVQTKGYNAVSYIPRMRCFLCVHTPAAGQGEQTKNLIPIERVEWFRL